METDQFKDRLRTVLETYYQDERFGVPQLAQKLHLSRSQLHRKLVTLAGKSASRYIREYRLHISIELLRNQELTVSEVAYSCGFSSPSYFNTCFRKHFGFPPGEASQKQLQDSLLKSNLSENQSQPQEIPGKERAETNGKIKRTVYFLGVALCLALLGIMYLSPQQSSAENNAVPPDSEYSIAVLPFKNFTGDEQMDAVCEGITDDMIARLENYEGFERVISRTSSFQYRGTGTGTVQFAKALNVSHLLKGKLELAENGIKIVAQLVDGRDGRGVWANEYVFDWESRAIFEIQSKLAREVVNSLNLTTKDVQLSEETKQPTTNKEAYDLYLQGVYQTYRLDEKSLQNAEALLTKAISLDSSFARAYTGLGYIWSARGFGDVLEDQKMASRQAKYYFSKARELDPTLWQNELYALQAAFYLDWDFKRLEAFYQTDFLKHVYSRESSGLLDYAIKTGRYGEALQACENSIEVNPLDAVLFSFKARALWFLGRKKEALGILEQMDALYDKDWFYLREAAHNYYMMGEYDRSFKILDQLMHHFDDRSLTLIWLDLMRAHQSNRKELVQARLEELQRAYNNEETGSPAWYLGLYHASTENYESALNWLERSYDRFDVEMTWLLQEPLLQPLRSEPRYLALVDKVGFPR